MNVAHDLLAILDSWNASIGEAWGEHRDGERVVQAVQAYAAIRSVLTGLEDAGEDVSVFLEGSEEWLWAIIQPNVDWRSIDGGVRNALTGSARQGLRMLASYLDHTALPDISQTTSIQELAATLQQAYDLIANEPALPLSARTYLLGLVQDAMSYLETAFHVSGDHLRRLTHEISGAMYAAADSGALPPERTPTWHKVAKAVAVVVVPGVIALSQAAGDNIAKQLPGGSDESGGGGTSVTVVVEPPPAP